jgi:hypothetical protein
LYEPISKGFATGNRDFDQWLNPLRPNISYCYLRRIDERLGRLGDKLETAIVGLSRIEREVARLRTARRPKRDAPSVDTDSE